MTWLIVIGIQLLLLIVWVRATGFWFLINKADIFLRKSTLILNQHKFEDEAQKIITDQRPKYVGWKVENFVLIVMVLIAYILLPVIGLDGDNSLAMNIIIAGLLAVIGYHWNLAKVRVDILNIECEYVDNLVNIVKDNQTALENITE